MEKSKIESITKIVIYILLTLFFSFLMWIFFYATIRFHLTHEITEANTFISFFVEVGDDSATLNNFGIPVVSFKLPFILLNIMIGYLFTLGIVNKFNLGSKR